MNATETQLDALASESLL